MEEPSWLRAGAWERSVAEQWARDAAADGSLRHRLLDELCMSIESLVREAVSDGDIATSVIAELLLTLRHCDELDFKTEAQCLAYVCWHLADRYGRTQQALDALFAGGHLPVRVRGASIVEVGSGPAPAVHATGDYYRHLSRWCADSSQPGHMVPLLRADTLGRGLGWDRQTAVLGYPSLLGDCLSTASGTARRRPSAYGVPQAGRSAGSLDQIDCLAAVGIPAMTIGAAGKEVAGFLQDAWPIRASRGMRKKLVRAMNGVEQLCQCSEPPYRCLSDFLAAERLPCRHEGCGSYSVRPA